MRLTHRWLVPVLLGFLFPWDVRMRCTERKKVLVIDLSDHFVLSLTLPSEGGVSLFDLDDCL